MKATAQEVSASFPLSVFLRETLWLATTCNVIHPRRSGQCLVKSLSPPLTPHSQILLPSLSSLARSLPPSPTALVSSSAGYKRESQAVGTGRSGREGEPPPSHLVAPPAGLPPSVALGLWNWNHTGTGKGFSGGKREMQLPRTLGLEARRMEW